MEAALRYVTTHKARTAAHVNQVLHWLLMESLAKVMYSTRHIFIQILHVIYSQNDLTSEVWMALFSVEIRA